MFELPDNDPAMLPLTQRQRETFDGIEKTLRDLTRKIDSMDGLNKRLDALAAEVSALSKRHATDAAFVAEFGATGRTPLHMRAAAESDAFRKRDA
jgi:hypothetical protein